MRKGEKRCVRPGPGPSFVFVRSIPEHTAGVLGRCSRQLSPPQEFRRTQTNCRVHGRSYTDARVGRRREKYIYTFRGINAQTAIPSFSYRVIFVDDSPVAVRACRFTRAL